MQRTAGGPSAKAGNAERAAMKPLTMRTNAFARSMPPSVRGRSCGSKERRPLDTDSPSVLRGSAQEIPRDADAPQGVRQAPA
ncbi:MAG: hypothetical protein MZV64_63650 [Ignavibacteriales bacterium]|nr:hypothetical protein [Ignavibacteriales bacterium]